ncbi:hypothetical protein NE237_008178 [Protea cynaroides]|uniref:Uncharacterized protein n=1 Tax=Protea cynaroides TaxID=273540 RepID=A0A9Q0KQW8_9MAGN|nr:hypothetical protein NE237_008178 [Protea cynaroides]
MIEKWVFVRRISVAQEIEALHHMAVGFFMGTRPSFSLVKASLPKQWQGKMIGLVKVFGHEGASCLGNPQVRERSNQSVKQNTCPVGSEEESQLGKKDSVGLNKEGGTTSYQEMGDSRGAMEPLGWKETSVVSRPNQARKKRAASSTRPSGNNSISLPSVLTRPSHLMVNLPSPSQPLQGSVLASDSDPSAMGCSGISLYISPLLDHQSRAAGGSAVGELNTPTNPSAFCPSTLSVDATSLSHSQCQPLTTGHPPLPPAHSTIASPSPSCPLLPTQCQLPPFYVHPPFVDPILCSTSDPDGTGSAIKGGSTTFGCVSSDPHLGNLSGDLQIVLGSEDPCPISASGPSDLAPRISLQDLNFSDGEREDSFARMKQRREMSFCYNGMKVNIVSENNDCPMDLSIKMDSTEGQGDNMVGLNLRIAGPEVADDTKKEKLVEEKVVTEEAAPNAEVSSGNGHNEEEDDIVFVEISEEADANNPNADDWIML